MVFGFNAMSWKSSYCSDCASGWKIGAVPVEVMGYSHLQSIKPGSGAHPGCWLIATGRHSLGVKKLDHEADCSSESSAKIENVCSHNPTS